MKRFTKDYYSYAYGSSDEIEILCSESAKEMADLIKAKSKSYDIRFMETDGLYVMFDACSEIHCGAIAVLKKAGIVQGETEEEKTYVATHMESDFDMASEGTTIALRYSDGLVIETRWWADRGTEFIDSLEPDEIERRAMEDPLISKFGKFETFAVNTGDEEE